MSVSLVVVMCPIVRSQTGRKPQRCENQNRMQTRSNFKLSSVEVSSSRRHVLICSIISLFSVSYDLRASPIRAEEKSSKKEEDDGGIIGAITSLFDPNEKTKSGKVLPKGYLKSAREVVKTLRESVQEDPNDIAKFRRTADAAKESIREFLNSWQGKQAIAQEESYAELEKAIRSLAGFYSKAGPSAPLTEIVKSEILSDLTTAEEYL